MKWYVWSRPQARPAAGWSRAARTYGAEAAEAFVAMLSRRPGSNARHEYVALPEGVEPAPKRVVEEGK